MLASGRTAHYGRKPPVQPVIRWRVRWLPAWECEMRGAEGNGGPNERGPELVVVGHVGASIVHAGAVSWTSAGGSGYAVAATAGALIGRDRKSTRLNSSHQIISYSVFCLKKK